MENKPLKFNKPFRSDEQMLPEISLQYRLDTADLMSKSLADSEIMAHTYRVKMKAIQELLVEQSLSPEVKQSLIFVIDKVEERLRLYEERKKLLMLKQETRTTYEPLDKNEWWKKDTPHEFIDREEVTETKLLTMVHADDSKRVDVLDLKIDQADDAIESTYEHIQTYFPEDFKKLDSKFKGMQRENRTN